MVALQILSVILARRDGKSLPEGRFLEARFPETSTSMGRARKAWTSRASSRSRTLVLWSPTWATMKFFRLPPDAPPPVRDALDESGNQAVLTNALIEMLLALSVTAQGATLDRLRPKGKWRCC